MERTVTKIYKEDNVPVEFHDIVTVTSETELFPYLHWHDSIEILFFKEGTIENLIDGNRVRESADDIVVINSGILHSTRTVSEKAKYYALIIDKSMCNRYGFTVSEYYLKTEINDRRLFALVDEIKYEFTTKVKHYEAAITAKILEMLTILFRDYASVKNREKCNKNVEMVKKGIRYIKNNYNTAITIDDVSKSVGYSKYYFCRCFREITKYTVNSYINKLRVEEAYRLIAEKGLRVGEAAIKCGFDDVSYFTKIFKKYTSRLPSQIKMRLTDE